MSDLNTGMGKVVVNRAMSLDGFIAGPGDAMDWIGELVPQDVVAEVAAATGAMLVGRRTSDVGDRMAADEPGPRRLPVLGAGVPPHPSAARPARPRRHGPHR